MLNQPDLPQDFGPSDFEGHTAFAAAPTARWTTPRLPRDIRPSGNAIQPLIALLRPAEVHRHRGEGLPVGRNLPMHLGDKIWWRLRIDFDRETLPVCRDVTWHPIPPSPNMSVLSQTPYVLYDEHIPLKDRADVDLEVDRLMEGLAIRAYAPDRLLLVRYLDDKDFRISTPEAMIRPFAAHIRHRYNYVANFAHFGAIALAMALGRDVNAILPAAGVRMNTALGVDFAPHVPTVSIENFTHPGILRDLHIVSRASSEERQALADYYRRADDAPMPDIQGHYRDGKVLGTGKYEPYARVNTMRWVLGIHHKLGLAEDRDGEFRLTAAGDRFLELLHPRSFDPDICHRWLCNDKSTGQRRPLSEEDADRAIMLFFGRITKNLARHGAL